MRTMCCRTRRATVSSWRSLSALSDANAVEAVPFPAIPIIGRGEASDNAPCVVPWEQRGPASGRSLAGQVNCGVMVVDCHTHVFPPQVVEAREEYLRADPTFGELYGNPRARLATAPDLLASMERAAVDISFMLGFAWRDQEMCRRHNDYLLEWAARSGGRLVAFCTVNPVGPGAEEEAERCARAGARGLGELRPESQGWDLLGPAGERLASLARRLGLALLFHVSEPVGHRYAGKEGLALATFYRFAEANPDLCIVGAHLGGGLPFYAHMPEVREVCRRLYFDTAAVPLLYSPDALALVDDDRLLFGSDFPLLGQERALASLPDRALAERWSRNALALLGCREG